MEDIALTVIRVAVGLFFAISGFHKLFVSARHKTLRETLVANRIPYVRFNEWFVPGVEFLAGLGLVVGLLTPLAALGLAAICGVACLTDGLTRIKSYAPINRADWLDDLLYLPETVYFLILAWFVIKGAGPFSLDAVVWGWLI